MHIEFTLPTVGQNTVDWAVLALTNQINLWVERYGCAGHTLSMVKGRVRLTFAQEQDYTLWQLTWNPQ
jgi:hypothetical protein